MLSRAFQAYAAALTAMATIGLAAHGAQAADMPFGSAAPPLVQQPVDLGTGWYLRGDIGFVSEKPVTLDADLSASQKRRSHYDLTFGFGYKFNNWLRADVTYDWRNASRVSQAGTAPCVTDITGGVVTTANCRVTANSSLKQHAILANGYIDLGQWSGIAPYVGAGVGVATLRLGGANGYTLPGGGAPPAAITDPVSGLTYNFNYANVLTKRYYNVAYALMAGVAYDVTPNAKVDLGYRYLNVGSYGALSPTTGKVTKKELDSHEVRLGVRYMIDGAGL